MENIATIEPMTSAQAGRITDRFQAKCRKDGTIFPKDTVQAVSDEEMESLVDDMFTALRVRVERRLKMIIRTITGIDRTRTPQEALVATGRKQYATDLVVATMPKGEGDSKELVFFKPDADAYDKNGLISDDNLEKQFELRGLIPVDPHSLCRFNEVNPDFADNRPHATHWKDVLGKWCFTAFSRWRGERKVSVNRDVDGWHGDWSFVGVRK